MPDLLIIIAVAIGFPLFGLVVFFWWRMQYGVWSPKWKERKQREANVQIIPTDQTKPPAT